MANHRKPSVHGHKAGAAKAKKAPRTKRAGKAHHAKKTARKSTGKAAAHGGRKGNKSSYNLYIQRTVSELKAADPSLAHQDAFKKAASQWRTAAENPKNHHG